MSVFWDLAQQKQITDSVKLVGKAQAKTEDVVQYSKETSSRLDRLSIISRAMWELLSEKLNISEAELMAKMSEIDLRDGKADGKFSSSAKHCVSCNRPINILHTVCLYCGASNPIEKAFDGT